MFDERTNSAIRGWLILDRNDVRGRERKDPIESAVVIREQRGAVDDRPPGSVPVNDQW
jgi:hypothetical protein